MSGVQARANRGRGQWRWPLAAILLAGLAGAGVRMYFTATDGPLGLRLQDEAGQLRINWDGNAAAVRRAGYGVLEISEGPEILRLHLDRERLREGRLSYRRRSEHVTARLRLARWWASPVEETVVFVGTLPAAQEEATEAVALRRAIEERDALAAQVERLHQELRRQRARAVQLEEVNRLLRQRLEVEAARTR